MLSYPEDSVKYAPADYDVNKIGFILIGKSGKRSKKRGYNSTKQQPKPSDVHNKYYCHICERSYMTCSNLRRHMKTIHLNVYTCFKCNMEFFGEKASRKLKQHQCAEEPGAVQYNCDFCGHIATSRQNLIWHLELHRKLDIEIDDIFA